MRLIIATVLLFNCLLTNAQWMGDGFTAKDFKAGKKLKETYAVESVRLGFEAVKNTGVSEWIGCSEDKDATYGFEWITNDQASDQSGQQIEMSSISMKKAMKLFKKIAEDKKIPFGYPEDGCYARAHMMAKLLEKKGVISGKIFIEGDLRVNTKNSPKGYVEWWYHVAPVIKIKENGVEKNYVFDPSLFDRPVPVEDWVSTQTSHEGGRRDEVYATKRFNYYPNEKNLNLNSYDSKDISSMKKTMKTYSKIEKKRKKGKEK